MDTEWLKNLKPGDKVIIDCRFDQRVATVTRVTKTCVFTDHGDRFRIRSGSQIGDVWYPSSLIEETEESISKVVEKGKRIDFIGRIKDGDLNSLPIEKLELIAEWMETKD